VITSELMDELKSIIGEQYITENPVTNEPFGNTGRVAAAPTSEEDITKLLTYANNNGKTISIISGGTKRGFGGINRSEDILLSLENYKGVIEHTVGDMTVTVKAGTPFQELQDYLAQYNQKISLDPAWPENATIGGVIAANDSGPKRLGYGSARDVVIGLRIAYPDGTVIRSGGKVVKNVAGYDMNKLFIGSMGTLGVLTEVTLKLRPLPKYESLVLLSFPMGQAEEIRNFAVQLLDSMMEPVSLELLNPTLSEKLTGKRTYTLAISFEDVQSSVHYQEEFVEKLAPAHADVQILDSQKASEFWDRFYKVGPNGALKETSPETKAAIKIGVVNLDVIKMIQESGLLSDTFNLEVEAHGGLGHGLCQVYISGASEDIVEGIHYLRNLASELGGYATIKHLPLELRQKVDVWGENPSYFFLLEGIKTKVDPNRLLNPKRFVGGI
jgi:glycolate oxidase FAD binding subunit